MSAATFTSLPTRINGVNITADWFNALQGAGANIEAFLGTLGYAGYTTFDLTNNESSPQNVTGLLIPGSTFRSFELDYDLYVNTTGAGATEIAERGKLVGVFKSVAGTWEVAPLGVVGNTGIVLSIVNSTGQVQYTTPNFTGTPGTLRLHYRYSTMGV